MDQQNLSDEEKQAVASVLYSKIWLEMAAGAEDYSEVVKNAIKSGNFYVEYQAVANGKLYLGLNQRQGSLKTKWGTRDSWESMRAKIKYMNQIEGVNVRHLTFDKNEFQFWSDNSFGSA